MLERILNQAIRNHLISNNVIFPAQHGFQVRSCMKSMLAFLNDQTQDLQKAHIKRIFHRAPTGRKNPANEKQPTKPPIEGADKYASEVPSEPSTQTRRAAIKPANLPGYTTLGSSPSEAAETVLKCLSTNCLSLFNKLCDIKQSVCLEQPSIIALTETWLTPDVSDAEISIDGYSIFRADSKRGRAGGVALYLHAALPIPIVLSDTTPAPFCDALWLQVPLRGPDSLLLGVVYRSPSSPPEDDHFLIRTLGQLSSHHSRPRPEEQKCAVQIHAASPKKQTIRVLPEGQERGTHE
ncbi:hypothetical protein CLF_109300 [Clonorchis sinensis]|uniref:Reverse transcriptase domain-containing protein n=1 Tax=Clonorchis sinensis TaxID=79923 RepID=G7YJ68_CLOSI|nr:hypothetical protein CLF_109300 [Clonorchis sinensis]